MGGQRAWCTPRPNLVTDMSLIHVFAALEAAVTDGIIARYAVGGAVAAAFYIEPAATQDLDVFIVFDGASTSGVYTLDPLYRYFRERGALIEGEHLVIADWPVQFLPTTSALVEAALIDAVRMSVDGQAVCVFTEEYLAAIALETGRLKDKLRLLQFLESPTLDLSRLLALIEQYGLMEQWTRFNRLMEENG